MEMAENTDKYKADPIGMKPDALARRAAALRDNLAKRKTQQRARIDIQNNNDRGENNAS